MCPFCLASMGLIVASAASTGGLAALAVKLSRKKNGAGENAPNEGRNQDDNEQDREPQNSVA
jgi:hypothetical protein